MNKKTYIIVTPRYTPTLHKTVQGDKVWDLIFLPTEMSVFAATDTEAIALAKDFNVANPVLEKVTPV